MGKPAEPFKTDVGIKHPIPRDGSLTRNIRATLAGLAVGHSYLVPDESHQVKSYQLAKREFGYKVTSKKLVNGYRIWRVS